MFVHRGRRPPSREHDGHAETVELSQLVQRRLREPVLRIQQRTVEIECDELFHGVLCRSTGWCGKRHCDGGQQYVEADHVQQRCSFVQ